MLGGPYQVLHAQGQYGGFKSRWDQGPQGAKRDHRSRKQSRIKGFLEDREYSRILQLFQRENYTHVHTGAWFDIIYPIKRKDTNVQGMRWYLIRIKRAAQQNGSAAAKIRQEGANREIATTHQSTIKFRPPKHKPDLIRSPGAAVCSCVLVLCTRYQVLLVTVYDRTSIQTLNKP